MYLYEDDFDVVLARLDQDDEIAWLVENGPGEWIARTSHPPISWQRTYLLWHVPSGPLPLDMGRGEYGAIEDPWSGWRQVRQVPNREVPWLGPSPLGVFDLKFCDTLDRKAVPEIGMSTFGWIGNHYRPIGKPAPRETERAWNRLRGWVRANAKRFPREDQGEDWLGRPEVYAFAAAQKAIDAGAARARNPCL
jgi:hypothetical protein